MEKRKDVCSTCGCAVIPIGGEIPKGFRVVCQRCERWPKAWLEDAEADAAASREHHS